jgi:hypothetical protein
LGTGVGLSVRVKVHEHCQINLLEVIRALDAHRGCPGFAEGGQKYGNQQTYCRYHNEQFDKGKGGLRLPLCFVGTA